MHYVVVCGWSAAGQGGMFEDAVQVWRDFLQRQVVVVVAMRAASSVELLPCYLLIGKRRLTVATTYKNGRVQKRTSDCEERNGRGGV